jgi:Cu-processing system permease protein
MKTWIIATTSVRSFLRNRTVVLSLAFFGCVLMMAVTPLAMLKGSNAHIATTALSVVNIVATLLSGFGSLLAGWLGARAVAEEVKAGTILAILARPVSRWEFFVGKYLGIVLLMLAYTAFMVGFDHILARLGGSSIDSPTWILVAYPLVRYALYAALGMLFAAVANPAWGFPLLLVLMTLANTVQPRLPKPFFIPSLLRDTLYVLLPSVGLLSESRFLSITQASIDPTTWQMHSIALGYGLDYAFVCLMLAAWSFRHQSVVHE